MHLAEGKDRGWIAAFTGQNTGILLRSLAGFDAIRRHLRKFTRLRREVDPNWLFFRFWDPRVASVYFRTLQQCEMRAAQWFGRGLIDRYVVEEMAGRPVTVFRSSAPFSPSNGPLGSVVLANGELAPFRDSVYDCDLRAMAVALKSDFGPELKAYSPEAIAARKHGTPPDFGGRTINVPGKGDLPVTVSGATWHVAGKHSTKINTPADYVRAYDKVQESPEYIKFSADSSASITIDTVRASDVFGPSFAVRLKGYDAAGNLTYFGPDTKIVAVFVRDKSGAVRLKTLYPDP